MIGEEATASTGRDALGHAFFWHHILVVGFIALGWLSPWSWLLVLYLALLPVVVLQWRVNQDSCILNNIESLIRTGRWRNSGNPEEGAFLLELGRKLTGRDISKEGMNAFIYTAMAVFWGLGLGHLVRGT